MLVPLDKDCNQRAFFCWVLVGRVRQTDSCIVDQDIEATKFLVDQLGEGLDRCPVRDVYLDVAQGTFDFARRSQIFHRLLSIGRISTADENVIVWGSRSNDLGGGVSDA